MQTIKRIQERMNVKLQVLGVVVCRLKRTNLLRDVVAHLRKRFGDAVLTAMVRENERVAEAPSHALPITIPTGVPRALGTPTLPGSRVDHALQFG
jgi:chromosome partitioning protein